MKPEPRARMSDWWGVASSNGKLIVLHHIDSSKLAGARHHLTQAISQIVAETIIRDRVRRAHQDPPDGTSAT